MFGIGKPQSPEQQLQAGKWKCGSCDVEHAWPFDLAARAPDPWPHGEDYEPNGALRLDGDFLSEDFCVLDGKYFMIRCVLQIPVLGVEEQFGFGCWSTLSRQNFEKYVEGFDSGESDDEEMWSGWLCNRLENLTPGTEPPAVWVQRRPERQRPLLWAQDEDCPLAVAQDDGISAKRMLEVFRFYGHDPR